MHQLQIVNPSSLRGTRSAQAVREFLRHWLTGRRGLIIGGVVVVIAGLALGWNWLGAIGVAPILLSLAPCVVMCAVGACAMVKGNASCANSPAPDQAKPSESAPTLLELEK